MTSRCGISCDFVERWNVRQQIGTDHTWKIKKQFIVPLGKQLLSNNVAEMQLLTNHLCQHCLLALDLESMKNYVHPLINPLP
jgi:hypothetical protein